MWLLFKDGNFSWTQQINYISGDLDIHSFMITVPWTSQSFYDCWLCTGDFCKDASMANVDHLCVCSSFSSSFHFLLLCLLLLLSLLLPFSFFQKGNYQKAAANYKKIVSFLEHETSGLQENEATEREQLLLAAHLNLAMCHLKVENYRDVSHFKIWCVHSPFSIFTTTSLA